MTNSPEDTSKGRSPKASPQRTALYQSHLDAGGKLVDFSGWEMPVNYGSQIDEHHAVRQAAGMFDVSHMTILDFSGNGCKGFLARLLANDIARIKPSANSAGKALYTCMLNDNGGIVDDLIAYAIDDNHYRLVVNAGTREKDISWINTQLQANAGTDVSMTERAELAMIALQGPQAIDHLKACVNSDAVSSIGTLSRFSAVQVGDWFIARTGYTGEDGVEIALPEEAAVTLWQQLRDAGVQPCGLGARDTLRLEAGMNLYGSDMDESVSPLDCGLQWTVAWEPANRDFTGRAALQAQHDSGSARIMSGLVLQGRGVLRGGQKVYQGEQLLGEVTSGTFSPTLQKSIAFARLSSTVDGVVEVAIRDKRVAASVVTIPFVKNGAATFDLSSGG